MKNINKIKNGSLYFNTLRQRVERVIGKINTQRVWTVSHSGKDATALETKNLRMANNSEVEDYLEESPNVVKKVKRASLPPLPQPSGLDSDRLPPLPKLPDHVPFVSS